jgi:hypothetical protein
VSGPAPLSIVDDVWLYTDVWFANDSLYPPFACH